MLQAELPKLQDANVPGSARVSGFVLDASGASLENAKVVLVRGSESRTLLSRAHGDFSFEALAPGSYTLTVEAKGFASFRSALLLTAGQSFALPGITLSVAGAETEITVRPVEVVAEEQIKAEEKQRIIGVIPNFFTSYTYDAAPLTRKQKYKLTYRELIDPTQLIGAGIAAGIEQANDSYAAYGNDAAGYGKRFAANYGDALFADFLSHAVFPSFFHQDPRYFYQGSGTKKSRFVHAVSFAVIARSDDGKTMPNYSYLLGDIGGGLISNLYYPHADRGIGLVFTNAAIGIGARAADGLVREFVLKHFTTHVPGEGKPKP